MVLMTTDHAGDAFDGGHLMTDSVNMYEPGMPLPASHFIARWLTHLCAPTFVFLAGAALALSVQKRVEQGESPWRTDRFMATRGLFILALDPLWMSLVFTPGAVLCQVMFAIGGSMIAMCALRRLPDRALLVASLVLIVGSEAMVGAVLSLVVTASSMAGGSGSGRCRAVRGGAPGLPAALLVTGGFFEKEHVIVGYPLLSWLAIMMLGWWYGRTTARASAIDRARNLLRAGAASLALFVVLRAANGYGNMRLYREGVSLVQWLHVSKYPPSLTYAALELGLMALLLGAFTRLEATGREPVWTKPLLVFGQTALFFYVLHAHILVYGARFVGLEHEGGLGMTYGASLLLLVLLYPACIAYGRYKRAHPEALTRYL